MRKFLAVPHTVTSIAKVACLPGKSHVDADCGVWGELRLDESWKEYLHSLW